MQHKNRSQYKILIVHEEGWFSQPKFSTHKKKIILRCVCFCFYVLHFICEADWISTEPTYTNRIVVRLLA